MRPRSLIFVALACVLTLPLLSFGQQPPSVLGAVRADERGAQQLFTGRLSGAQEVPEEVTDTTALFRLEFNGDLSHANYSLIVFNGEGITQAHLHCGAAGVNGPVVAFLYNGGGTPMDVNGPLASGTLTNDSILPQDPPSEACGVTINNLASLLAAIRQDRVYVNVHSTAAPAGIVRDQLFEAH